MKKIAAAALLCALVGTPALAQSSRYWYGALDFGQLAMRDSPLTTDPGSMTLSVGYRMNRNLALEGGLTLIGESSYAATPATARQSDMRFVAMGILPLGPNLELFGKGGLGLHTVRVTDATGPYAPYTTTNIIYGFGGQVNVTPNFGLRLQYEALGKAKTASTDPGADISRITFGGVGRF